MKFELGTYVKYSNKNEKTDCTGTIIATYPAHHIVEVDSGNAPYAASLNFYTGANRSHLADHFEYINGTHPLWGKRSKKMSIWVPRRSRNLRLGELQYDPNQQGDTDEDI